MLLRGQGSRSDGLIAIGLPRADEVAVVAHAMLSKRMGDRFPQSTTLQGQKMLSRSDGYRHPPFGDRQRSLMNDQNRFWASVLRRPIKARKQA